MLWQHHLQIGHSHRDPQKVAKYQTSSGVKGSHPNPEKHFIVLRGLLDHDFNLPALVSVCETWTETCNKRAKETPTRLGIGFPKIF